LPKLAFQRLGGESFLNSLHNLRLFFIFYTMTTLLVIVHVIVCLALIMIVLLQHGKGAGIGAAFGGSSQTVFGSAGAAPFLAKLTAAAAILFMVTSLGLTFMGRQKEASIMEGGGKPPAAQTAPVKTEAPPAGTAEKAPVKAPEPAPAPAPEKN
jgi:preprotein translocase subunit SecG